MSHQVKLEPYGNKVSGHQKLIKKLDNQLTPLCIYLDR